MIDNMQEVLVVEDSDTQALQLSELLGAAGFRVRVAANGALALDLARQRAPDVILSDIAMPVMDGFALCRMVKADPGLREVPIILLTALNSMHDVVRALESGADNFIRKPYDPHYLFARLRHVIDARLARHGNRVQVGLRIQLGGETHFIDAERQQILDLLVSTYEEAVRMTEQMRVQQQRLAGSYQSLEGLYRIATAIGPALHAPDLARLALQEMLELPGLMGGAVLLLDGAGGVYLDASAGLGADAALCETSDACACRAVAAGAAPARHPVRPGCTLLAGGGQPGEFDQVVLPLQVGNRALGAMAFLADRQAAASADGRQVLGTAVQQIAVAIERAQLYSDSERLVRERTEALNSERHLMSSIVKTSGALVMLTDPEGHIVLFNPACEAALGWTAADVAGRHFCDLFLDPERAAQVRHAMRDGCLGSDTVLPGERWRARDGSERRILWKVSSVRGPDQARAYWLGTGLDVTETEGMRERLRYLSDFDTLTGLPNRASLRARAQSALETGGTPVGLLWVQCERLPLVRESLGMAAEQALLAGMAERLAGWQRDGDCVARCDEAAFALLVTGVEPERMADLAEQILALLAAPFQVGAEVFHASVGVGIAVAPGDGRDFDRLVQAAAAAARQALAEPEPGYAFHRPERLRAAGERFKLEAALRQALERDELFLHYQPQVSLHTGRIVGLEALLRWRHPALGLVSPAQFIPLAEDTGLILPIGDWVLREACRQLARWRAQGVPLVPVAVNLSARQFSGQIVDTVRKVLDETGVDPAFLEIELTESLSMDDPERSFRILAALREVGVQLSIDDFGTGYSNLNYLKRFPVQKLKLDQSFVRELVSNPDDLAIARAVIAMAHSLRLQVIAEGVETDGQLVLLRSNACDEIQGYLFSRPVDADAAARMLQDGTMLERARLARRRPRFAVLYVGRDDHRLTALRLACGNSAELIAAATAEQAFEVLAQVAVTVLLRDIGCGSADATFLGSVQQLYPNITQLELATQDERTIGATGAGGPVLALPLDVVAAASRLRDALDACGMPAGAGPDGGAAALPGVQAHIRPAQGL